jgi:hypothetical protein
MDSEKEKRRRWLVKDSMFAPWRELPGEHTATEVWLMRWQQRFWAVKHVPEEPSEGKRDE